MYEFFIETVVDLTFINMYPCFCPIPGGLFAPRFWVGVVTPAPSLLPQLQIDTLANNKGE